MLNRYLKILDAFMERRQPMRVEAIAEGADLPLSSAYRLVREMASAGLLTQVDGGQYWLGVRLLGYGGAVWDRISIREVARPVMRRLADETGETIHLTIVDGLDGVYVEKVDSPVHELRSHIDIGRRVPLYAGSAMKLLLAYLDERTIAKVLRQADRRPLTPSTVTDADQLRADLAEIRARGWAVTREEINIGATGVSAPIFHGGGAVAAAMTITGATARLTDEVLERCLALVLHGAAEVSAALGAGDGHHVGGHAHDGRRRDNASALRTYNPPTSQQGSPIRVAMSPHVIEGDGK